MNVEASDPSDPFDPKRSGGTGSREEAFWERYRRVVRTARVEDGVAVWYRRHVEGFIRFLKPRRLREAEAADVAAFLLRMHRQEDTELWQVKQADKALRLLYQELVKVEWAQEWSVPLPMEEIGESVPSAVGTEEVKRFLEKLAVEGKVSASTQNQALNALVFYFRAGLGRQLGQLGEFERAKRSRKLPVVLSRQEIQRVLSKMEGGYHLMASLMYGAGLRLMECVRLRVKDVDIEQGILTVRDGKGAKDRVTMLPGSAVESLRAHLQGVRSPLDGG